MLSMVAGSRASKPNSSRMMRARRIAVDAGHPDVEEHKLRTESPGSLEGMQRVAHELRSVTHLPAHQRERHRAVVQVVHDQDALRGHATRSITSPAWRDTRENPDTMKRSERDKGFRFR